MANPAKAYLTTQVETTTPGELLLMLYEAAIKFLKRACIEIDNKDYAKKGIYISKAMAIIHELTESLNKERGGDISPKLAQLYIFCTSQLTQANIKLDKKKIEDVIKILDGLRSAYAQIIPQEEGKGAGKGALKQAQAPRQAPPVTQASPPPPAAPAPPTAAQNIAPPTAAPTQAGQQPQPEAQKTPPAPQQQSAPTPPPTAKPRTAAQVAKFRAANAYGNANR